MIEVEDRALPFSLEAERALLGALLISDAYWPQVVSQVTSADFFRDAHRRIFEAMARLVAQRQTAADFVLLLTELQRTDDVAEVGGPAYVASLTDGLPQAMNVAYYAAIVREKAQLRRLVTGADRLLADAYEGARTSADLIEDGVRTLFALARTERTSGASAKQAVDRYMAALSADEVLAALPTGFLDIDGLLGGFHRHDLTMVAARPSVGKTSLVLRIADQMATAGIETGFFSLEMREQQLAAQLMAWRSRVPTEDVRRKRATPEQYASLADAWARFADMPLHIEPAQTFTQIIAACRRLKQERGLQCAVIDYIQLLSAPGKHESRQAEVAYISRMLKRLAEDDGLAVVALSQLKRPEKGRPKQDRRPQLSDLRESGALEQDADVAILLYRPEMHQATEENAGLAEVIVAKNRTGPTGVVKLYFNKSLALFRDLAVEI